MTQSRTWPGCAFAADFTLLKLSPKDDDDVEAAAIDVPPALDRALHALSISGHEHACGGCLREHCGQSGLPATTLVFFGPCEVASVIEAVLRVLAEVCRSLSLASWELASRMHCLR